MKRGRDIEMVIGTQSVFKIGTLRYDLRDPFHMAVTMPWIPFLLVTFGVFFAINAAFAIAFVSHPGSIVHARPGSFFDAFYFCVETMATVGYGGMSPGSPYGHFTASVLSVVSIAFTAVATGIIFVRFSRPRSRMMFADRAVIAQHDGKPTLMVRLAYSRASVLVNTICELDVMMKTQTKEGSQFRQISPLPLLRRRMPALILAWTVMHVIDEQSPLYGLDAAGLAERDARIILTIEAKDQQLGVEVFDVTNYAHDHIAVGVAYADIVSLDELGRASADLTRLSELAEPKSATALGPA